MEGKASGDYSSRVFWLKGSRETTRTREKRQVRRNCWFYGGKGNSMFSASRNEPVEEKEVSHCLRGACEGWPGTAQLVQLSHSSKGRLR